MTESDHESENDTAYIHPDLSQSSHETHSNTSGEDGYSKVIFIQNLSQSNHDKHSNIVILSFSPQLKGIHCVLYLNT